MTAKRPELRLPDEGVLAAHAHCVGDTGSGKQSTLLAALGGHSGDGLGQAYFRSVAPDALAAFLAKFRDARPLADPARHADGPGGGAATGTDESESTESPR